MTGDDLPGFTRLASGDGRTAANRRLLSAFKDRGVQARYFRYPGLHQGETGEQRSAASSVLARLGYTIAQVTLDNSEWLLADAYGQALLVNDIQKRDRIGRDYIDHILSAVRHFDDVAQAEFGRQPPHVLLLHEAHAGGVQVR